MTLVGANDITADQFGFVGLPPEYLTTGGIPLMDFNNYQDLGIRNFRPQFQNPSPGRRSTRGRCSSATTTCGRDSRSG